MGRILRGEKASKTRQSREIGDTGLVNLGLMGGLPQISICTDAQSLPCLRLNTGWQVGQSRRAFASSFCRRVLATERAVAVHFGRMR